MAQPAARQGLLRSLRTRDLTAVVINGVIGAGIFGLPSRVFALSGDYSLLAFFVCAICVAIIVASFAEVASRFSETGGPYLYARVAFGPGAAFAVGWLLWVARVSAFAANCSLLAEYLALFVPAFSAGPARAVLVAGIVAALTLLNIRGIRPVATASNVLAVGKLVPLFGFAIVGLFFLHSQQFDFRQPPEYRSFALSVLLLVFAFTGFEMGMVPAGESTDPKRNLPTALLSGMAVVIVLYVLVQVVCIGTLPGLAASKRPLADAAGAFLGPWGAAVMAFGLVLSLAGNLNVIVLSASRTLFAMGEQGDLPASLARLHPSYRTPVAAVLWTTAAMLALTLSGTYVYLVTVSTLSRLAAYLATCGAMPVFRRRADAPSALFRTPGGVPMAMLGVLVCLWLFSSSTWREARDTLLAAGLGFVLFAGTRWWATRGEVEPRRGS
ncbi:APC family permease [uncultured Paludibaculum sp.]|uniref:APC family permease n=1 Tax=uncultured Paludibaculum sp. TaxID=1765020 RepID=UPI002AAB4E2B|nr:APC family permease [uncultured Paludibaculum sp.]